MNINLFSLSGVFLWRICSREKEVAFDVLGLIFFPKSYALCHVLIFFFTSFLLLKQYN